MTTATRRAPGRSQGRLVFFREFLRSPAQMGSIWASGKSLSRKMVEGIGIERAAAVVELGPGPGPVTTEIVRRIPRGCRFLAIERNAELAVAFRERFPHVRMYEDDAVNIAALCRLEGIEPGTVDCIVSGLPFLLFPDDLQHKILGEIRNVLRPGGYMSQVTLGSEMLPNTRKFRRTLEDFFGEVRRAGPVLVNVPPAFVYRCRK